MGRPHDAIRLVVSCMAIAVTISACGSAATPAHTSGSASTTGHAATVTAAGPVNPAAIPLGDGHLSTSPRRGYVDSCQTSYPSIGGAEVAGPWLDTAARTWDSTKKIHVQGAVSWPAASYSVTLSGGRRIVKTDDLPIDHTTGTFPVSPSDPAYAYDRNPNTIVPQSITWSLPAEPTPASSPSCTAGGPIGVLVDGVLLFNALDGEGRDAGAHEVLDGCDEHPQMDGQLHHHSVPSCLIAKAVGTSTLVGYAIDGYGIYVERDAAGRLLSNAALDACHGRTSQVLWDGKEQVMYHYDATIEYPYTVGCFRGAPISAGRQP